MTNEIDWSKAPEGATHYDTRSDVYPWLKEDDNGNKYWNFDMWVNYANDIGVNDSIFAKPLQPVFTKAMADNGEFPSVGMDCKFMHGGDMQVGTVTAKTKRFIIFTEECGMERVRKIEGCAIEAITPPIELIDGERYEFTFDNRKNLSFYNSERDEFKIGSHYWRPSDCTNIQLLEVKS